MPNKLVRFFKQSWYWLFPITREKAIKIAMKSRAPDVNQFRVFETLPENMNIYGAPTEPCWYISAPWGDGPDTQPRSSRVIIVSRKTGRVLYDGSANDEG